MRLSLYHYSSLFYLVIDHQHIIYIYNKKLRILPFDFVLVSKRFIRLEEMCGGEIIEMVKVILDNKYKNIAF